MVEDRIEAATVEEPEEVPKSSWVLVGQFFVVPIIIVALCVGIFILFGLITGENRTARDYLEEVRAGKGSRRWQAAFELSKHLSSGARAREDPRLVRDLNAAFRAAKEDDPRVRQYLALAMGRMQDPSSVEPLIHSLGDRDPDTRLYVIWALGELRDVRAVEPLLGMTEDQDPNLRKMVVYSLGMLQDQRALPSLRAALNDRSQDVRWNAALALARLRDPSGVEIIHQMLDRKHLESLPAVSAAQVSEAMINAARAAALLKDSSARSLLEEVRENDQDLKVRGAAIEALKEIP